MTRYQSLRRMRFASEQRTGKDVKVAVAVAVDGEFHQCNSQAGNVKPMIVADSLLVWERGVVRVTVRYYRLPPLTGGHYNTIHLSAAARLSPKEV